MVRFINTVTFAARDFSARRGANDEHIPQWICKERATKSGRKRTAARKVAPNLAFACVARRLQTHGWVCVGASAEAPRALPQAKLGATNVTVFMKRTTKHVRRIYLFFLVLGGSNDGRAFSLVALLISRARSIAFSIVSRANGLVMIKSTGFAFFPRGLRKSA